ncbi:MAG TPA: CBS domain-containing protein [Anaerolineae bacterium]|nr:CBS domain-containing protein [Anaerolineae bacterium]
MLVQDIMASDTMTISPSASIAEASAAMLQKGTTSLFASNGGRLLGIITDRDILYGVVAKGLSPTDRKVWEFMDFNPPVAYPSMSMLELVSLMDRHRLTRLPVVKDGKLVGTVTLADVAAKLDIA